MGSPLIDACADSTPPGRAHLRRADEAATQAATEAAQVRVRVRVRANPNPHPHPNPHPNRVTASFRRYNKDGTDHVVVQVDPFSNLSPSSNPALSRSTPSPHVSPISRHIS